VATLAEETAVFSTDRPIVTVWMRYFSELCVGDGEIERDINVRGVKECELPWCSLVI
jgi:hypothetical protein